MHRAVATAKSIKLEYYELAILNLTLFVAIYIKDLPILYVLGSFLMIYLVFSFIVFGLLKANQDSESKSLGIIDDNTQAQLLELRRTAGNRLKEFTENMTKEDRDNSILYVLLV